MTVNHDLPDPLRPLWLDTFSGAVRVIDQRCLPHDLKVLDLACLADAVKAIATLAVRGAPLIGITAAYGLYLGLREMPPRTDPRAHLDETCERLKRTRPTAVNLAWAVDQVRRKVLAEDDTALWPETARRAAAEITQREIDCCQAIGRNGVQLIEALSRARKGAPVHVLTHCNAGWLATMAYGTATAPIYEAHARGLAVHVWVDETRPLNQGARLTAWELGRADIPHTVITDNCGGHLMQQGLVDLVIVGTDRTTAAGDVVNKIGTYLKALAARDNQVPFYVALPSSSFDWDSQEDAGQTSARPPSKSRIPSGIPPEIPIEQRDPREVHYVQGLSSQGICEVRLTPPHSPAANYAFDVTPARLVTGFITERGCCPASTSGIAGLFPEGRAP
ncbi:MAG: S-methyl-5-thioribose-1-phosphate isomerase [Desulfobacterales bacterium]